MPTFNEPVVAPSFIGAVYDRGGAVFNVKAYGAVGDGLKDDTAAVVAAVSAANALRSSFTESAAVDSGKGAVIFFPPGIYLITREIHLSGAVTIRGAGMYTTQLRMSTSEVDERTRRTTVLHDGLVWDIGPEPTAAHHVGGGIEDIDVITQTDAPHTAPRAARDLVVLIRQHNFHITNVRVHGSLQNGVRMEECVHVTAANLFTHSCGTAGVMVASVKKPKGYTYNTTINFQSCYFQNTSDGPGADVSGYGITFDGCVFEGSSAGPTPQSPRTGTGVLGRWGSFTLTHPYFEHNFGWDMWFGSETPEATEPTTVTVINPMLSYLNKLNGTGAFRADNGIVTLLGGSFTPYMRSNRVSLGAGVSQVYLLGNAPNVVTDNPAGLGAIPGLIMRPTPAGSRGAVTAAGTLMAGSLALGGGGLATRQLSFTLPWAPGPVAHGAVATAHFDTPETSPGDTVVASFTEGGRGLRVGVLLFGSVTGDGQMGITLLNQSGEALAFGPGTLRIDVWKP